MIHSYLVSAEAIASAIEVKALRPTLEKKDVHGQLLMGRDLTSEYMFKLGISQCFSNLPAGNTSQVS